MATQQSTLEDQATREDTRLKKIDPRLSLARHECEDGSTLWRVIASFDDDRPDEIARSQETLKGIADAYRKQLRRRHHREERERTPRFLLMHHRDGQAIVRHELVPLMGRYGFSRTPVNSTGHTPSVDAPRPEGKRRQLASASSGSSRGDPPRGDDPDPPAPRPCECGCGDPAPPGRRTVDEVHATRIRLRRLRDRRRVDVDPEARLDRIAHQRREAFVRRGEALGPAAHLREHVNALAEEALEKRLKLPTANGDTPDLLARLRVLDEDIARTWEEIRTAEAVAR